MATSTAQKPMTAPPSTAYKIVDVPEINRDVIQRHFPDASASPVVATRASRVNQETAHHPGRKRKEVRTAFELNPVDVDQPEVGLVDESRCLQGMTRWLTPHVAVGKASQFVVDERHQPIARVGFPPTPRQ